MTPRTCGASTQPARSSLPSATSWASVASTGAVVITGEQIRTRRRARPIARAIAVDERLAVAGREPRAHSHPADVEGRGSTRPLCSTAPVVQSSSKFGRNAPRALASGRSRRRSPGARTSRRSSSSSPSRRVSPSRTTYLWCMRSGTPAIARAGTPSDGDQLARRAPAGAAPGSGCGGRRCRRSEPRRRARPRARIALPTTRRRVRAEVEVVVGEVERVLRPAEELGDPRGDARRRAGRRRSECGPR